MINYNVPVCHTESGMHVLPLAQLSPIFGDSSVYMHCFPTPMVSGPQSTCIKHYICMLPSYTKNQNGGGWVASNPSHP